MRYKNRACAFLLACTFVLTSCNTGKDQSGGDTTVEGVGNTPSESGEYSTTLAKTLAGVKDLYLAYDAYESNVKPNVPASEVQPNIANIVNRNQYIYGTDEVGDYYFASDLTPDVMALIVKNGFAVDGDWQSHEYFSVYESNRYNYVPSFITVDSAVHSFHLMYDYVLKDVEQNNLNASLKRLSTQMTDDSYAQLEKLKGTEFENAALRNVAFFSVGSKLLDDTFAVKAEVADLVAEELALIKGQQGMIPSPIVNFGEEFDNFTEAFQIDYSQYTPRGHYTQTPELEAYFKATMWYGQFTLRSAYPDEVKSALLITSALQSEQNAADWSKIFETINFFVGECDDITPIDYSDILGGNTAFEAVTNTANFDATLAEISKLPPPAVNSVPIYDTELQPDRDKAITGFRFLGQRVTLDAAVFQKLIERDTVGRLLPKSLDIPAALGSKEALAILTAEGDLSKYPTYEENLNKVQTYINGLPQSTWNSNLYWSWLNMLRPLAGNYDRTGYPTFMQNNAWTDKELNTFQGNWTELKHDTILYAKQPMGEKGGGGEEPPPPPDDRGYVEPNPEVYARLATLVKQTNYGLIKANLITDGANTALDKLFQIATTLQTIAEKELNNEYVTNEEYEFIRQYGAELEHIWDVAKKDEVEIWADGWFAKDAFLAYHPDAVIADVATSAEGDVLEEATGYANMIYVAFSRDGEVALGRGVVYSQYEFASQTRMTDEEWHEILRNSYEDKSKLPPLASWKKSFTATK
ncbi:MAG: DUF3160 domain-containing protein [Oscillospiraceae bacterium]|jgi:hypothetical protein|nr:DUF3160 domain-containing protein [Oscillospiraceae bacterium]